MSFNRINGDKWPTSFQPMRVLGNSQIVHLRRSGCVFLIGRAGTRTRGSLVRSARKIPLLIRSLFTDLIRMLRRKGSIRTINLRREIFLRMHGTPSLQIAWTVRISRTRTCLPCVGITRYTSHDYRIGFNAFEYGSHRQRISRPPFGGPRDRNPCIQIFSKALNGSLIDPTTI